MSTNLTTLLLLLLATTILPTRSCTTSDCQNECEAYIYAKTKKDPTDITIEATLSNLTNNDNDFIKISNLHLDRKDMPREGEENACYFNSNQTKGCTQYLDIAHEVGLQCPWTYQCDYNQNRIPQYLWRADCNSTTSVTVHYPVPVLKRESCNPLSQWQLVIEDTPVACACKA